MPLNRILVPVDGSDASLHAARHAAELAETLGAHLTLMHVVKLTSAEAMGMRHLESDGFFATLRRMAEPTLAKASDLIDTGYTNVNVDDIVSFGDPAEEIVAASRTHTVDLIVMGHRGLTPLSELLLGSVSEKVVRRAPCPVTIVR